MLAPNKTGEIRAKRTAKNSVFLDLFKEKHNLLKLYQTLHPEDTDTTEDSLQIVTLNNVLTDNLYNDLGIMVGEGRLLLLIEAQSTWTENILIRILLYLAQTYHEYFILTGQSLYTGTKVKIPKPELYVIYTGNEQGIPDVISLSQDFLDGKETDIEIKVRVIYEGGKGNIIHEYISFCKIFDEKVKTFGMTKEAVEQAIEACRSRNVLTEYLSKKEVEVVSIMMSLFDDEQIIKTYAQAMAKEAAEKAAEKAAKKAAKETVERLIKNGKLSLEEIADCFPMLSLDELKEIKAGLM